ncbi:MAG: translation elongation factor Ts [Bacteroidales bacterium]|nr:translation elongation factor Ts [Bacteroidales bacterium]
MANITAADVNKLRKQTGAGMMDCKKALTEADGDFEKAIEIIREKGQAVAKKRSDREASEGVVFAKTTENDKKGFIISMNCETDFVAKNDDFVKLATQIIDLAVEKQPNNLDELKQIQVNGKNIEETINYYTGIIGEKLELAYYDHLEAPKVTAYIHMDNKLAALVGLNKENVDQQVAKNVAMQVAAMDPVAVDKDTVPQDVVDKEYAIGKKQAQSEGKPDNILDKIAKGKVEKFMKENTLLNQEFIRDSKKTVREYLQEQDKELTVMGFKYYSLKQ